MTDTPTDRLPSEPEMQDLHPRPRVLVIDFETCDFADLEARVLAAMGDSDIREIVFELDHRGGEITGRPDLIHGMIEEVGRLAAMKAIEPAPRSYLDHDPTKRLRSPRKSRR